MIRALFDSLSFTPTAERLKVARFLLYLLASMGMLAIYLETRAGNLPVVMVAAAGILLAPVVFITARLTRLAFLPLYVVLAFMVIIFHIGAFTQHNHPENFVWYSIYPIVWFSLAGLRTGTLLSVLGIISWIASWFAFPSISGQPRVAGDIFAQALAAYVTTSIFSFIYEHSRLRQEHELKEFALSDFLTGALNRRGFIEVANAYLDESRRFQHTCAVAIFDLDHFKAVNDAHGHEAGDKLLQDVVCLTREHLRQADRVARWGGEEFIVLLPHTDLAGAHNWAEKLRHAISRHQTAHENPVTASFGVACYQPGDTLSGIIRRADEALYQAKQNGRNQVAPPFGGLAPAPLNT